MKIIGHRGARGLAPENTIASLKKAVQHHVDELEFDLRVSKDQVVVLHHNPEITDAAGNELLIAKHKLAELRTHKPDLATFEEVLRNLKGTVPLLIEVKPDETIAPIVAIIKAHLKKGWKSSDLLLASFSQKTLLELHRELPDIQKVVNESWSGVRATARAKQLGTKRLSMRSWWLWRGFITPMARRGWQLSTYTLDDVKKAKRWGSYGLYGVITDYPDRFEQ